MITRHDLVETIHFIVDRDNRVLESIYIYDRLKEILITPYTGDTQYPEFIEFMRKITKDTLHDEQIVQYMTNNPSFFKILKSMNNTETAWRITNLFKIINNEYKQIEHDLTYLTLYRTIYKQALNCINIKDRSGITEEEKAFNKFILYAFDHNPFMSIYTYEEFINTLYESLFTFLFSNSDGFEQPKHDFLRDNNELYDIFRFDLFLAHIPVTDKIQKYTCSKTMINIIEITMNAIDYVGDFFWLIEPYKKIDISEYLYLFEESDEPI